MTDLTLAVVSDLHTTSGAGSYILADRPHPLRNNDPLVDLIDKIEEDEIEADFLLIPGDVTDKANPLGLKYGWNQLHRLARIMGATILAVPGNHDLVTHEPSRNQRAMLKKLSPSYPTGDRLLDQAFWDNGWAVIEQPEHRILLIDSTFTFPTYPVAGRTIEAAWDAYEIELNRGGFHESQQLGIDRYLRHAEPKLNIAMIHHHPVEHQLRAVFQDSYGPMHRGGELVELLTAYPQAGRWLLIHGHKHVPQIVNAGRDTTNGPIVFCAASLGAHIWEPLNTVTRNQFHLARISTSQSDTIGPLVGEVRSLMWCIGDGWVEPPAKGGGLPRVAGFGTMVDYRIIARRCTEYLERSSEPYCLVHELKAAVPEISYMAPRDFIFLEDELERQHLAFIRNRHLEIQQLSRMA